MQLRSLFSRFSRLVPKSEAFFTLLAQQGVVIAEAGQVMANLLENGTAGEALERMHQLEHMGDELVRAVVLKLDETYVTPIDREDIHNLATALDNALDYLHAAAYAFVSYEIHAFTPAMRGMVAAVAESAQVLMAALPALRSRGSEQILAARRRIAKLEKQGDDIYRGELASLYKRPEVSAKDLLRQQSVLNALEEALDSCQQAADLLENVAIKHS